jgi:hypothetical protein
MSSDAGGGNLINQEKSRRYVKLSGGGDLINHSVFNLAASQDYVK